MEAVRNIDEENCFDFLKLPSSQWCDHFIIVSIDVSDFDVLAREIELLKPKVREDVFMLSSRDNDAMKKTILLIHLLDSLGLSYHFVKETEKTLSHAFEKVEDLVADENDLYTISTMFRVFRTYGHNISSNVFNRFKGSDGKFKENLKEDVKGMVSFYESVFFGTTTDYILDEASSFTLNHLKSLLVTSHTEIPSHISKLIENSLHIPQHRHTQVLVAREYISFYEQENDRDETLLKLAKCSFKFLQLHYLQELKTIMIWWRELDHTASFPPKFRERTVETWFLALMMHFEPQFSLERVMSAKLVLAITFLDDACDIHGSILEVESLADCLERWDPEYMENLQGHMKTAFKFVMYVFEELEEVLRSQGRSIVLEKMIEEFKVFVRGNLNHIKWGRGGHMPSFEEYIEAGGEADASYAIIAGSIMGLGDIGGKEAFEWLISRPKLINNLGSKTRILDDIVDFEEDKSKEYTANALNYYMKEHGITKEEAIIELEKMIEDINKIVNEECLKITTMPRRIIMHAVNFSRAMDVTFTADDCYNNREGKLKDYMRLLLVEPIHP